jgi:hypothetical protein
MGPTMAGHNVTQAIRPKPARRVGPLRTVPADVLFGQACE